MGNLIISAGPLIAAPPKGRVLLQSSAQVVHSGAGLITTNVSLAGYPALDKTAELLTGMSSNTNDYYIAAIYRDASNLVIKTCAGAAMTIRVGYQVVEARGKILRLAPAIVSSSAGATGTHTNPGLDDISRAKIYYGGMYASSVVGYHPNCFHRLDSGTDLYSEISRLSGSMSTACPLVIEYGRAA